MDANTRPADVVPTRQEKLDALDRVRRRVTAIGFLTIALHGIIALPVVAGIIDRQGRTDDAVVLVLMSGVIGVLTVAATLAILGRTASDARWLVLGLLPPVLGAALIWWYPISVH